MVCGIFFSTVVKKYVTKLAISTIHLFLSYFRETDTAHVTGEKGGGRDRILSRLHPQREPDAGLDPTTLGS